MHAENVIRAHCLSNGEPWTAGAEMDIVWPHAWEQLRPVKQAASDRDCKCRGALRRRAVEQMRTVVYSAYQRRGRNTGTARSSCRYWRRRDRDLACCCGQLQQQ